MKKYLPISILSFFLFSCHVQKSTETIAFNAHSDSKIEKIQDSLSFELCKIYGLDQGIRDKFLWRNNIDFGNVNTAIDTLNFNRVIDFVKRNGFPTKQLLGEDNIKIECVSNAVTAVLLHNPHRLVLEKKHFDLFLNEVKAKRLTPEYFSTILDKYYWTKSNNKDTRRVFYGSQFGKPCIQTKIETNLAREEIGLKPLEDSEFVDCSGETLDMPANKK
jgi:hypothetical protein